MMSNPYETLVINAGELRVGMYVILTSWVDHPTLKSEFLIESKNQIKQIVESGFRNVRVDLSRSLKAAMPSTAKQDPEPEKGLIEEAPQWGPEELVPPEYNKILIDKGMDPTVKAAAVKTFTLSMINKLNESPTAENVKIVKSGVYGLVDMLLEDEPTANELIKQADYNPFSHTHSVNVGIFSIMLAKRVLNTASHNFHELGAGFFLHDIGKVQVDPGIINKSGRLNKIEMDQMKKHPEFGYKFLRAANQLSPECGSIILQHHERVDGNGYPQGLIGEDIHLYARICSIADVYDALTSQRSYRKRLKPFDALTVMRKEMLGHIQKDIFEHLVFMLHGSIRE